MLSDALLQRRRDERDSGFLRRSFAGLQGPESPLRKRSPAAGPHHGRVAAVDDAIDVDIGPEIAGGVDLAGAVAGLQGIARVYNPVAVAVAGQKAHRDINIA